MEPERTVHRGASPAGAPAPGERPQGGWGSASPSSSLASGGREKGNWVCPCPYRFSLLGEELRLGDRGSEWIWDWNSLGPRS